MAFLQLPNLWVSELADDVAALVLDVPGDQTNSLGRAVLDDLDVALNRLEKEGRFRLLIVRSGKEDCFATGPNIDELSRFTTPDEFVAFSRRGQDVLHRLQTLSIPSAAIIGGVCLGTGFELALACDYRIVVRRPATRLGFANADLGLLPAWGGTQRLPRLIGLERSLHMLIRDRQLSALAALEWGLASAAVDKSDDHPPDALADPHKHSLGFLPKRTWRQWFFERFRWGRWLIYHGMERLLKRRLPDDLPAPALILEAVRRGLDHGILAGQEQEREAIARLSQSEAFRNLLGTLRFGESVRALSCKRQVESAIPIGVVGAGTRGLQILTLAIARGCEVVVREASETSLGRAMYQLLALLVPAVQGGGVSPKEVQEKLAGIKGTTAWKGFADLELVLEATGSDPEERKRLFRELEKQTGSDIPLVTTSALPSLDELRSGLDHPHRLARMHFIVPLKRGSLVEVVGPPDVEKSLAERLADWVIDLGCVPVLMHDRPGLLVRRIWLAALQEAIVLLQEGIPLRRIDEALRRFGTSSGPLEQADLVGLDHLDLLASALEPLFPERFFQDEILAQMIDKGWLGRKTRLGFYQYGGRKPRPNPQLLAMLRGLDAPPQPILTSKEQMDRCRERIVARTVNEAAWCLEEGLLENAETLDFALALAGWAPHRGGPITYARRRGVAEMVQTLEKLANALGPRFLPCPGLKSI